MTAKYPSVFYVSSAIVRIIMIQASDTLLWSIILHTYQEVRAVVPNLNLHCTSKEVLSKDIFEMKLKKVWPL